MGKQVPGTFSRFSWLVALAVIVAAGNPSTGFAEAPVTPTTGVIDLLDGGLERFYSWSRDSKYEDPLHVYTYANGVLQITGESWGGLTTKKEYANYHMVFEFKWGEKTWGTREERARDSGILVHCTGPDGAYSNTWMASIEAQIIEGGVGDILVIPANRKDGSPIAVALSAEVATDRDGETIWKRGAPKKAFSSGRINWHGRDPDWDDVLGFRGQQDVESPHGQWTRYEIICEGGKITAIVNGTVVNEGTKAKPSAGKILVQSEGAELFVRRWELWPLGQAPASP